MVSPWTGWSAVHQERQRIVGEGPAANCIDGQGILADSATASDLEIGLRRLDWMGPLAFKARHGAQPGVDRDFGHGWGPRHDQRLSHRRATLDSPTGLLYAYDLTWDEFAVLATDIPAGAVEAVINRAMAMGVQMSAEVFAGLLVAHLVAQVRVAEPAPEVATVIER